MWCPWPAEQSLKVVLRSIMKHGREYNVGLSLPWSSSRLIGAGEDDVEENEVSLRGLALRGPGSSSRSAPGKSVRQAESGTAPQGGLIKMSCCCRAV